MFYVIYCTSDGSLLSDSHNGLFSFWTREDVLLCGCKVTQYKQEKRVRDLVNELESDRGWINGGGNFGWIKVNSLEEYFNKLDANLVLL